MRRYVAPVFAQLDPEEGLEPHLRHPARDPRLPRGRRGPLGTAPPPAARDSRARRDVGRDRPALAPHRRGGCHADRPRRGLRARLAVPPRQARPARPRRLRRPRLSLGALGSRGRPHGRARGRGRHRRERRPGRPRAGAGGRLGRGVPAVPGLGPAEARPPAHATGAAPLHQGSPRGPGAPLAHLLALRAQHLLPVRRRRRPRAHRDGAGPPRATHRRPGAARGPHTGLRAGMQAGARLERLLQGPHPAARAARLRADRARDRRRPAHRRRGAARRRHGRPRHRVHRHRASRRARRHRPGRAPAARRLARRGTCAPGHHRHRLPEPVPDLRPRHKPGRQLHRVPAGVPGPLRRHPAPPGPAPRGGDARGPGARHAPLRPTAPAGPGAQRLGDRRLHLLFPGRVGAGHDAAAHTSLWYWSRTRWPRWGAFHARPAVGQDAGLAERAWVAA